MTVEKGLYTSVDRRYNLYEIEKLAPELSDQVNKQAESVACLVDESLLVSTRGEYQIVGAKLFGRKYNLGKGTKFRKELVVGMGTAFLIGKQLALTAAHCVCRKIEDNHRIKYTLDEHLIEKIRLVFGFQMIGKKIHKDKFEKSDVYRIRNIVAHHHEKENGIWYDWAVLRLDRDVENRTPLNFTLKESYPTEKTVYMLGHPRGLPMKLARNAEIKKNDGEYYFEANLDAFQGNSGSPVFLEETQELIGILVEGNKDFIPGRDSKTCTLKNYVKKMPPEINKFEICQKVTSLFFLKAVLSSIDLPSPVKIIQQVSEGLSLEVVCDCDPEILQIVSRGFGKFNMSEECAKVTCPSCETNVHPDKVNVVVLSSCEYQVEGLNIQNQEINCGPFSLLKGLDKTIRFNVQNWYYIEFDIKKSKIK